MTEMKWTDNHCHLPDDPDLALQMVQTAKEAGVHRLIDVGTSIEHSLKCITRANEIDGVWATAGVHPHDAKDGINGLERIAASPKVVAIGECGLDYYYDNSPRNIQREIFAKQIQLVTIGDQATGKTALTRKFCKGEFSEDYIATLGIDYVENPAFTTTSGEEIKIKCWDTAG